LSVTRCSRDDFLHLRTCFKMWVRQSPLRRENHCISWV
jgi:hypothetical protein